MSGSFTPREEVLVAHELRVIASPGDYRAGLGTLLRPMSEHEFKQHESALQEISSYLHGPLDRFDASMDNLERTIHSQKPLANYPQADPGVWQGGKQLLESAVGQAAFAFTSYIDSMKSRVSNRHGSDSEEAAEVGRLVAKTYDTWPEYRVAYGLRNALAHSDQPILISRPPQPGGDPDVLLIGEAFVANPRLNKKVREEVRTIGGVIDVVAMMRRLRHILRGLDKEIRDVIQPDVPRDAQRVASIAFEARDRGGFPQIVSFTESQRVLSVPISLEVLNFAIDTAVAWACARAAFWPSGGPDSVAMMLGTRVVTAKAYGPGEALGPISP